MSLVQSHLKFLDLLVPDDILIPWMHGLSHDSLDDILGEWLSIGTLSQLLEESALEVVHLLARVQETDAMVVVDALVSVFLVVADQGDHVVFDLMAGCPLDCH